MKKLVVQFIFVLIGCILPSVIIAQAARNDSSNLSGFDYLVKESDVSETLQYLTSDELEGRETGTKGMEKAALFLEQFFKKNNVKPYFSSYRDTLTNFKGTAYNIVGCLEGTDPVLKKEYLVISGHYDHIGLDKKGINGDFIYIGAYVDASGVSAVAEMAKYFSISKSNKRSILFVFFVGEEKGLLGSKHLAEKLKEKKFNIYAQLNIEMIGVPMKRDYLAYITGFDKSNMAAKINGYTGKKTIGFLPKEAEYQLFYRSDNYSFYNVFHVPCQSVSTFDFENFEYYHHVSDEFKAMDIHHMTLFIQEFLPAVTKMASSTSKEIFMVE
jgi:Zn-dependent M28 family amino/carboxypeptidase